MKKPLFKSIGIVLSFIISLSMFAEGKVLYSIDFSNVTSADARAWLKENGFSKIESAAKDPDKLGLYFQNNSLVFDTKTDLFAFMLNPTLHLDTAKKIRITWGVNQFPDGASYDEGVRNEALMVYVYFGDKDQDSGSFFIPNCPYFIGLYLSKADTIDKFFTGRHFTEGGRFVCVGHPKLGETVVSEYNIYDAFKKAFPDVTPVPFVSGVALEVETSSTGPAKAFIKKIEILD
ncbi:MAG TPA: hypothetical protein DD381_10400 [Lentisphaeria bacterium]|nr:MAG: hypothetical protein A2X47_02270 [Lentisphaerae bacterium GWF2_38_69]HBM16736.1 hypothetical protein [Lentisphaeria bacterium]